MRTREYLVEVEYPVQGKGFIDRAFDCNEDEHGNHSAWTTHQDRAKRWKTKYGANVNAARYERHNPPARTKVIEVVIA